MSGTRRAGDHGDYQGQDERRPLAHTKAVCHCGGQITWRLYPALPFPDSATEQQLARQAKGGRWIHFDGSGGFDEWCPPRRPYPVEVPDGTQ